MGCLLGNMILSAFREREDARQLHIWGGLERVGDIPGAYRCFNDEVARW